MFPFSSMNMGPLTEQLFRERNKCNLLRKANKIMTALDRSLPFDLHMTWAVKPNPVQAHHIWAIRKHFKFWTRRTGGVRENKIAVYCVLRIIKCERTERGHCTVSWRQYRLAVCNYLMHCPWSSLNTCLADAMSILHSCCLLVTVLL